MTRTIVAIVVFLAGCSQDGNATADVDQRADFGFRFSAQRCVTESIDTFTGVFTKELGGEPSRTATVQLSLSDAQMGTIYQTIEKIRFFDYPSPFYGVPKGISTITEFGPASTYRLEVRNDGVVHTVSWNDAFRPTTDEADRLRALFSMITEFIHRDPGFQRLPRENGGCE